jgi:serine/threonine-protein kinase
LKLSNENIAGWQSEYDDSGNEIKRKFFDTKNNPTLGNLDYAGWTATYNGSNLEEWKYMDQTGGLLFAKSQGYAGIKYKYDERGNVVEIAKYGVTGPLSIIRYKYDKHDNETETAYYDKNNRPDYTKGYFKVTNTYNERNQIVECRYYDSTGKLTFVVDNAGKYAVMKNEYDPIGRIIRQTYFDENGKLTPVPVHIPEGLIKYDKWGNMNYRATADGYRKLINNPQTGYAIERWVYDIRGNKLEEAVFDRDNKICTDKNNTHKITYTYNKRNENTEIRYYSSPTDLRKENFAIIRMKYDTQGNRTEYAYYNQSDKAIDYVEGVAHKAVISYDGQNPLYKKWYKANGTLLLTQKWNGKEWTAVNSSSASSNPTSSVTSMQSSNWREPFQELAKRCPYTMNNETSEMLSVVLSSNSCTMTKRYIDISKYNISNSDLEQKKNIETAWMQEIKRKTKMPNNAILTLICADKAKRELFRITY